MWRGGPPRREYSDATNYFQSCLQVGTAGDRRGALKPMPNPQQTIPTGRWSLCVLRRARNATRIGTAVLALAACSSSDEVGRHQVTQLERHVAESSASSGRINGFSSIDGVLWVLDSAEGFSDEELQAIADFDQPPSFVAHRGDAERGGIDWVEVTFGCVKDGSAVEWSNDGFRNVRHPDRPQFDPADCSVEQPDFRSFYSGAQGVSLRVSLHGQLLKLERGGVLTATYRSAN